MKEMSMTHPLTHSFSHTHIPRQKEKHFKYTEELIEVSSTVEIDSSVPRDVILNHGSKRVNLLVLSSCFVHKLSLTLLCHGVL